MPLVGGGKFWQVHDRTALLSQFAKAEGDGSVGLWSAILAAARHRTLRLEAAARRNTEIRRIWLPLRAKLPRPRQASFTDAGDGTGYPKDWTAEN